VGLQGFKECPRNFGDSGKVDFDICQHSCPDPCHPLPFLAAQLQSREVIPGVYSMTEVLKPYRIIHWTRHNSFWVAPGANVVMVSGSAVHSIIEEGGRLLDDQDAHKMEVRGDVKFAGITLRGTYDYADLMRKKLWDYKNLGTFRVDDLKKFLASDRAWYEDEYSAQMNGYRAFFWPEAEHLLLEVLVQGWTARSGHKRIEQFSLPVAPIDEVRDWFANRIKNILAHENGGEIQDCTPEETWKYQNRCKGYCHVSSVCPQFKGGL
jgi:hypothetical protein